MSMYSVQQDVNMTQEGRTFPSLERLLHLNHRDLNNNLTGL